MAKLKNAKRKHYIGVFDPENPTKEPTAWLRIAKNVTDINDDTDETTDSNAFYDGDGTEEDEVTAVKGAYTFEGQYDSQDEAQAMIVGMKYKTGDGRKAWHKVVDADEVKERLAVAIWSDIIGGSGAASDYEEFSTKATWTSLPIERDANTPTA